MLPVVTESGAATGTGAGAATLLQRGQVGVAHKRAGFCLAGQQRVPGLCIDVGRRVCDPNDIILTHGATGPAAVLFWAGLH